ncbi:MAG: sulfite exporter TauE/SafE family protein [Gemmatimonadaceae bacterium]|nr:sulfite exporter TauE/SafE family protein [Gemmatimonadaceae bacterium]
MSDTNLLRLALIVVAAAAGGAINSVAGGGTLLTFPALIGLGVPAITANATSTVALWPGAVGSMLGYMGELKGARSWAVRFAVPSLLGGFVGARLLLVTPADRFDALVPWLVLGATALFLVQRPAMRWLRAHAADAHAPRAHAAGEEGDPARRPPPISALAYQFAVGVYGGYFGAGIGILMLAALGFMGFTNIHRMNGLKNWGGLCINLMAALTFVVSGLVDWPVAIAMALGAALGGYGGSRLAQRVPQERVRQLIIAIGLASGIWLLYGRLS